MAFLLYLAQASLYAAIMWGIYCIVWRNRPLHRHSRVYLLASLVLPGALPFIHIPIPAAEPQFIAAYSITLTGISAAAAPAVQSAQQPSWPSLLVWLYAGGGIALAALYIRAYARLHKKLRAGCAVQHPGYTIITGTTTGPGTLWRRIFFPAGDADPLIVRHELAHIRAGHRYDSLLLQVLHVLFWISPAHWLLGQELKTVHEFEADRAAGEGIDPADYVSLLLSQSFGAPHGFAITHSFFHHPIKRRIMMLQKTNAPKRGLLLLAAIALTAGFMSTVLPAHPRRLVKHASASSHKPAGGYNYMDAVIKYVPPKPGEIRILDGGAILFKTVDEMPAFKGNLRGWLAANLNYPDSSRANKVKEGSLVEFTVTENGHIIRPRIQRSSGDRELDDEALRAVGNMPDWKPGVHSGRAVPVIFTLAIYFKKGEAGC